MDGDQPPDARDTPAVPSTGLGAPSVVADSGHFRRAHERWLARRHRVQESNEYPDEWWAEQCGQCRFWVPLTGVFQRDYGACTNPASSFDKSVMFEHDGCEAFVPAIDV